MKNFVYLVWDYYDGVNLVAVCDSKDAARRILLEHLESAVGYDARADTWWKNAADNQGYDSVEEFKKFIRTCDDYYNDLDMGITVEEIISE